MNINSRLKDALFLLVRQGLWQKAERKLEPIFPLSDEEWQYIYIHSRRQSVQGVVYDGVLLLPDKYYPSKKLLLKWVSDIDQWERINIHHIQLLCSLHKFFNESTPSVPFELIKGLAVSVYYPNPLHRVCGDIDLYFCNPDSVKKASERLEQVGISVKYGGNNDSSCVINQVIIELHPELIELHNPIIQGRLRKWEKEVFHKSTVNPVYNGIEIPVPIPEAHHILISTHILKHLLNEGVGLRQLCDAAILLKGLNSETDKSKLKELCSDLGIYKWSCLLYSFLSEHLGLPEEYLPFKKHYSTSALLNEIWESGNMGFYDMRKGERPQGKWKNKIYTVKQISRKGKLFLKYAPAETFWWPTLLTIRRIKEIFVENERTS